MSHERQERRIAMCTHAGTRALLCSLVAIACLHVSLGGAEAAPTAPQESLEHRKRAAEDLWDELTEGRGKAVNHDHWERIVRRAARGWNDPYYSDNTLHIVNVQDYYRQVLEDWTDSQREQELARLMQPWNSEHIGNQANVQTENVEMQKRIPGRYIVMLDSSADGYTLDRTIAILQHAHRQSEGRIRAEHITPMRNLGVGLTATMNSKTVELVSLMHCIYMYRQVENHAIHISTSGPIWDEEIRK